MFLLNIMLFFDDDIVNVKDVKDLTQIFFQSEESARLRLFFCVNGIL